jgi:hypothetical protein
MEEMSIEKETKSKNKRQSEKETIGRIVRKN